MISQLNGFDLPQKPYRCVEVPVLVVVDKDEPFMKTISAKKIIFAFLLKNFESLRNPIKCLEKYSEKRPAAARRFKHIFFKQRLYANHLAKSIFFENLSFFLFSPNFSAKEAHSFVLSYAGFNSLESDELMTVSEKVSV